eukprot:Sspe_Gene.17033::Locus_6032_Transcript_1_1_Confidence_1.000_Length_1639::g.17033::m.17033/K00507/SCD, desC; stearoyl-CoA desaturase (Delta-9 desaturase)
MEDSSVRPLSGRDLLRQDGLSDVPRLVIFLVLHVLCLSLVVWNGVAWGVALLVWSFRMFCAHGGCHRYFSHRAFKTSRAFQVVMAYGATGITASPLWWAAQHTMHHRWADTPFDVSSPNFGWRSALRAQFTWYFELSEVRVERHMKHIIPDLLRFPEIILLHQWQGTVMLVEMVIAAYLGYFNDAWLLPGLLCIHCQNLANSFGHLPDPLSALYQPTQPHRDQMQQAACTYNCNAVMCLLSWGECNHNNHHADVSAANFGWTWYQPDPTYWVLCMLEALGVVWDVTHHRPPPHPSPLSPSPSQ